MLKAATDFMGGNPEKIELQINEEFYPETITAQDAVAMMALVDRGTMAEKDLRIKLRKANWIDADRTDEDIEDDAEGDINRSLTGE
jgi:hypothetical protein